MTLVFLFLPLPHFNSYHACSFPEHKSFPKIHRTGPMLLFLKPLSFAFSTKANFPALSNWFYFMTVSLSFKQSTNTKCSFLYRIKKS